MIKYEREMESSISTAIPKQAGMCKSGKQECYILSLYIQDSVIIFLPLRNFSNILNLNSNVKNQNQTIELKGNNSKRVEIL